MKTAKLDYTNSGFLMFGLLILYLIIEIPIYFNLTSLGWWQSFAAWFASI